MVTHSIGGYLKTLLKYYLAQQDLHNLPNEQLANTQMAIILEIEIQVIFYSMIATRCMEGYMDIL